MNWNVLDIIFGIIIVFFAIRGVMRGLIGELFSVGAVVAGLGAAVFFSAMLAGPVERTLNIHGWGQAVAFLGLFLVVYIVLKIVEKMLKGVIETINLENLDKALGLFLGLLEGFIIVGFLVYLFRFQTFVDMSGPLTNSLIAGVITPLVAFGAQSLNVRMK